MNATVITSQWNSLKFKKSKKPLIEFLLLNVRLCILDIIMTI
jgi:hypothetical protein